MSVNWSEHLEQVRGLRRWLHQHPELTWQERETGRYVREQLSAWHIDWRPCAEHGCVATLAPHAEGEHLALRSDMDALPIAEPASPDDTTSLTPGAMHACGHDGHMAVLLGTARWLKAQESRLPGPVSLLFQPAEEGGHGARRMIEDGALAGVDCIFGWHNWPALPFGKAVCPDGAVMSGNGSFHIRLVGRGGHASQPELTRDPVLAAAALTLNLQQIVSRRLPPQAAAVVSVTSIDAKNQVTVIPDSVMLEGSIRLSEPRWREPINTAIRDIAASTAEAYGTRAEVEIRPRYEATVNHPGAAARYRQALRAELGEDSGDAALSMPLMASEDFSYYLQRVPGAFALIGMADAGGEPDFTAPCHSPAYRFNDDVMAEVMRVFCRLAGTPVATPK